MSNTDEHFKSINIVNFDLINNELSKEQIKQYQFIDHQELNKYPRNLKQEISSSIFRNIKRQGMYV